MCGIAGIFRRPDAPGRKTEDLQAVRRMTARLVHRGPDDQGFRQIGSVCLGHRRLCVLDLTSAGRQPMSDRDAKVWLSYNGEIYNYRKLRTQLIEQGQVFSSQTDSEVVLLGYKAWGLARLLERLDGMFAFAIHDVRRGESYLVRDRFGIKPLFYHEDEERLSFASELPALVASVGEARLDREGLARFLALGCVPSPTTALTGYSCLEGGHYLRYDGNDTRLVDWARTQDSVEVTGGFDAPITQPQALRARLEAAVQSQLVSDVPLGVFLSGGLDSSALVALATPAVEQPLTTVSIGFAESEFDETADARAVATHFGTRHHEMHLSSVDFWDHLPRILETMGQPTIDGVNSYFVSRAAKQAGLTVALSGIGADELFLGYPHYRRLRRFGSWLSMRDSLPGGARRLGIGLAANLAMMARVRSASRIRYLANPGSMAVYGMVRGLFTSHEIERLTGQAVVEEELWAPLANSLSESHSPLSSVMTLEYRHYLHNQLLMDADQMSMAHSVEVRVPFLDRTLVDRVSDIDPELRLAGERNKSLLAQSVSDLLPSDVVERPKRGFSFPLQHWIRDERQRLVEAIHGSAIFEEAAVESVWNRFMIGQHHWSRPWALYVASQYAQRMWSVGERVAEHAESSSPLSA